MFEEYFGIQQPLDFDDLANLMLDQGQDESPSWLHGGICGVLAGGGPREPDYCLGLVSQALDTEVHGDLADYCMRMVSVTLAALSDEEYDFQLFLPDDEIPMSQRLASLGSWCRAFLAAYALAMQNPQGDALAEETAEILKDMSAIADVDSEAEEEEEDEEEAERSYFELTEYLRFSCLNLFMDSEAAAEDAPR